MKQKKNLACFSCGGPRINIFYAVDNVPVNSVLLIDSREEALAFPRGQIRLGYCPDCGHIFNTTFDPALTEYSGRYESTQSFSATFNHFNRRLAADLIERFELQDKSIIEIGCGHGEFLTLLCEMSGAPGLGFDPAYQPGRVPVPSGMRLEFIPDFYTDHYAGRPADFVVCKMTLEHILDTGRFVRSVRQTVGHRPTATIFFQIPNGRYVFGDLAFWDVYYEHCSYFTPGSLASLFRRAGFDITDLWTDYDEQYLMIAARPAEGPTTANLEIEDDLADVAAEIERFRHMVPRLIDGWRQQIQRQAAAGQTIVLWGGGSKAVAFLTSMGITDEIKYAVDINPHKAQTFLAGSGQEIITPGKLPAVQPDVVIIMNPVYKAEISASLKEINLFPRILTLGSNPLQLFSKDETG